MIKDYKYSIAILVPYFGKLPSNFEYWKKTVLKNSSIDFFLFTDNDLTSERNLHIIRKRLISGYA